MSPFYSKLIQVKIKSTALTDNKLLEVSTLPHTSHLHLALSCEVRFKTLRPKVAFDCRNSFKG